MTPSPQHLKEAMELIKHYEFWRGNASQPNETIERIASALCLSESIGVKKGMMRAAEIADKHICKPRREEDGPCMCAIVVQCEIEEAIRTQAEEGK